MFRPRNLIYLHILSEILVLCSLVVWMSSYRKRTTSQIEKLLLRIEEQDEKIQKLEQQFLQQQQLSSFLSMPAMAIPTAIPTASMAKPKPKPKPPVVPATKPTVVVPSADPLVVVDPVVAAPEVAPPPPVAVEDLDALIQAELAELNLEPSTAVESDRLEIEEISTEDLKKKSP